MESQEQARKFFCICCDTEVRRGDDFCPACEKRELGKIGGWLYIPLLGLLISVAMTILNLMTALELVFAGISWTILWFELFAMIVLLGLLGYTAWLFLRKKRQLRWVYIILIAYSLVFSILDAFLVNYLYGVAVPSDAMIRIFRNLVTAAVWIPYFLVSVRVKLTFVR
ncbi:hypothetical protein SB6411_04334 [Klebsiella spallanzanii]|uniref:DUF2569 domain-containing protein n=1 Tax=Klebsiella spallanzanii TaxID=2587528 RepID=A0A564H544_9ENTR|nr:DUF2569 domain-containing protein [Klebsiella spallanzanii]VUS27153.1 hypothetical protein SB6411_04334 [Klebsiella spallanzanii]VUS51122.1 hypothetical protein SB6408_04307 [Klebsiella spallanzanii]